MADNVPIDTLTTLEGSSAVQKINENFNKLSTALDQVIWKDGREAVTGDIDFNSKSALNIDFARPIADALEQAVIGLPSALNTEYIFRVTSTTQSVFTLPVVPKITTFVYLNGVRLSPGSFSRLGASITLLDPAVEGDVLTVVFGEAIAQTSVTLDNVLGFNEALVDATGSDPVRDFSADVTGTTSSSTSFSAMFSSGYKYTIPSGSYRLNSDVSIDRPFSWEKSPNASFTGPGEILATDFIGFNYTPDFRNIMWARAEGTAASPKTSPHAVAFVGANSNLADTGSTPVAALSVQHNMYGTVGQTRAQGIYSESIARVSGPASFVEGTRSHGIVPDGILGKAYGGLNYAQNGGDGSNTIGAESEIRRTSTVTVKNPRDWVSGDTFDGMWLATANTNNEVVGGPGSKPNFGFSLNMYSTIPTVSGFLIPKSIQPGNKTVSHTAFGCLETGLSYGLDLAKGSYTIAAIALPNDSTIRAYNAAGTNEHNIFYYDTSNRLVLGEEAAGGVFVKGPVGFQGTSPISKPTISGSRGGNAALADLLAKLALYGLITDGTSA